MPNDYLKLHKSLWHEAFTTSLQIVSKGPVPSQMIWWVRIWREMNKEPRLSVQANMAQNGGSTKKIFRIWKTSGRVWTTTRAEDLSQNFPGPRGAGQAGWHVGYSYEAAPGLHREGNVIPGAGNRCNRSTWGRRHHLGSARPPHPCGGEELLFWTSWVLAPLGQHLAFIPVLWVTSSCPISLARVWGFSPTPSISQTFKKSTINWWQTLRQLSRKKPGWLFKGSLKPACIFGKAALWGRSPHLPVTKPSLHTSFYLLFWNWNVGFNQQFFLKCCLVLTFY